MTELYNCVTCGGAVRIVSDKEGTSHYEPVQASRCANCATLEARYWEQEERILKLTAQVAKENPDSQGVGELMATNNSENRMLGKRLMNAEARAEKAETELAQVQATSWCETAKQYARNADYYRSLVVEIGELFGQEALIADDRSVMEDVLCAKVPSLVQKALAAAAEMRATLDLFRSECKNELVRGRLEGLAPDGPHAENWNPPCALALALTRAKQEAGEL